MNQDTAQDQTPDSSPPEIWNAGSFEIFQKQFSPAEQRQLLHEDLYAQTRVSAILAALICIGMLLAILSVLLIVFLL
jgi:hypothetical protein